MEIPLDVLFCLQWLTISNNPHMLDVQNVKKETVQVVKLANCQERRLFTKYRRILLIIVVAKLVRCLIIRQKLYLV